MIRSMDDTERRDNLSPGDRAWLAAKLKAQQAQTDALFHESRRLLLPPEETTDDLTVWGSRMFD